MGDAGRLQRVALALAVVALSLAVVGLSLWVFDLLAATGASADDLTPVVLQDSTMSPSSGSADGSSAAPPSTGPGAATASEVPGDAADQPGDPADETDHSPGMAVSGGGVVGVTGSSGDDSSHYGAGSQEPERLTVAPPTQSREYSGDHDGESDEHSSDATPATQPAYGSDQGGSGSGAPDSATGRESPDETSREGGSAEGGSSTVGSTVRGSSASDGSTLSFQGSDGGSPETDSVDTAEPSGGQEREPGQASKRDED